MNELASLKNVTKNYGLRCALSDMNFSLERGQVVALLGPNGAGKTTAVKLMLGLLSPSHGEVKVFGADPRLEKTRERIGAMLQVSSVPTTLRVWEHIDLFSSYYPQPLAAGDVIERAGLNGLEKRMYSALSGGEQRRVQFALALCGNPDLLFLDEPTTGLDVESRRALWRQIRAWRDLGKTVLLTTHYLEEADQLADRIVFLRHGNIVADGTPQQIKQATGVRIVRCVSALPQETISQLPGVGQITRDRDHYMISSTNPDMLIRRLFELDPTVKDIEVAGSGIEEAFLNLTSN